MDNKTKLYVAVGFGVLALILIIIAVLSMAGGGAHGAEAGAAGAAAAIAAAAAAKSRGEAKQEVQQATDVGKKTVGDILAEKNRVDAAAAAAKAEVKDMSHDAKQKAGEDLFKPGGGQ